MKTFRLAAVLTLLGLGATGCINVIEGPSLPPDPNARPEIRGDLPRPAPAPKKDLPAGQSPLYDPPPAPKSGDASGN